MTTEDKLVDTPFRLTYEPENDKYPGYWIYMDNRVPDENGFEVSLLLFMGLSEESAQSIYDRLNCYLLNYLKDLENGTLRHPTKTH